MRPGYSVAGRVTHMREGATYKYPRQRQAYQASV
jgi:hypothetical protein